MGPSGGETLQRGVSPPQTVSRYQTPPFYDAVGFSQAVSFIVPRWDGL